MPHPFPLASVFSNGMRRDVDRTELPGGSAYNMIDFIPDEIQAVTGGRGGWTYAGPTMSGATQIQSVGYYPDNGKIIATDQASNAWDVVAGTTVGSAAGNDRPFYHRGKLIFAEFAHAPTYYNGTTIAGLSAPQAGFGTVYKDHSVLANASGNTNRIWFSAAGDPTTWDTTFGWWDTTNAITGVAATLNAILVFHGGTTERLRGTTPPPGSDMVLEPFFNDGCIDRFSIAHWQEQVVFASSRGIYLTNGVSVVDLTAAAQMKNYWASTVAAYDPSTWRIAGGIYRDHYIVSINHNSALVDCFCVNLNDRTMWRFSNLHGGAFLNLTTGTSEKLYMAQWNAGRVAELSSLWSPSSSVKQDADGTNPAPIVETGMFRGFDRLHRRWIESMGKQKWRYCYADYDLRDSASDNPTMTLSYCTSPAGAYTATDRTLAATTSVTRIRRSLSPTQGGATHSQMLGLKMAVNGPYASANLYTLEGAFEPIEIGAL